MVFCSPSPAVSFLLEKQQYFTTAMRKVTTTPTTIPAIFPVAFVAFLVVVVGIRTFDDPVPVYEGLYVLADPPEGGGEGGGGDGDGGDPPEGGGGGLVK